MRPYETIRVKAADGSGHVEIDVFEEHHMGAATTRIRPSRPIEGVSEFFATGGSVKFTSDSRWLVLHDRVLVVACEWPNSRSTFHFSPSVAVDWLLFLPRHRPRYLTAVEVGKLGVFVAYETGFHTQAERRELRFHSAEWNRGLGPASNGEFPSSYEPDIRSIRAAT